jgi:hypothetical protein
MSRTVSLARSASVVLDSNGDGTAEVGPAVPGEIWVPASCSISCGGSIPTTGSPSVYLYAGNGISQQYFVDSTYNVLGASSSMISGQQLYPGQNVFAVWTSGPPGETATLAVNGTRTVPLWARRSRTR